jgi:hypothetical protein
LKKAIEGGYHFVGKFNLFFLFIGFSLKLIVFSCMFFNNYPDCSGKNKESELEKDKLFKKKSDKNFQLLIIKKFFSVKLTSMFIPFLLSVREFLHVAYIY